MIEPQVETPGLCGSPAPGQPDPDPSGDPGGGTQDPRSRSHLPAASTIACWESAPRPPPANSVNGGSVGRLPGGNEKQLGPKGQAGAEEGGVHQGVLWREAGGGPGRTKSRVSPISGQARSQCEAPRTAGPCPRPRPLQWRSESQASCLRVLPTSPHMTVSSPAAASSLLFKGQSRASLPDSE